MQLKIILFAVVASVFLSGCRDELSKRDVYLKKAGPNHLDEVVRMYFPGGVEHQEVDGPPYGSSRLIYIDDVDISDTVVMHQSGLLAVSGRVVFVEPVEEFGLKALKIYMLYGEQDCSNFITSCAEPCSLAGYDLLFPRRMTNPRYVRNIVLTVLNPQQEQEELDRGDYLSVCGDWGDVTDKTFKRTAVSQRGVNNYYIRVNGFDVLACDEEIYEFHMAKRGDEFMLNEAESLCVHKGNETVEMTLLDFDVTQDDEFRNTALTVHYKLSSNGSVLQEGSQTNLCVEKIYTDENGECISSSVIDDQSDLMFHFETIHVDWSRCSSGSIWVHAREGDRYSRQYKRLVIRQK